MAVSNFIQSIWSKKILDDLEVECKLVQNCLTTYEGDCKYAASVKILGVGEPTISDYTGGPITIEEMDDKGQLLEINQAKSFAFYVHDVNKAQSVPGLMEEYQKKAVHGLAVARDSYVATIMKELVTADDATKTAVTATACSENAIKQAIDDAIVKLREDNFNEKGVIEITPAAYNAFKNCLITLSTDNTEFIKRGVVGQYDGFDVVLSNNLAKDASHAYCVIRGTKAVAFAGQINEVEALRAPDRFADIIRGLDTFGSKVIDAKRIQIIKVPLVAAA